MRLRATLVVVLLSCTPGPAPKKALQPHPQFPITEGATHALGKQTPEDGEVKCQSCHLLTQARYAQFECTACHAHEEGATTALHTGIDGFQWASAACYGCHGNGTASRVRHDPAQDVYVTSREPSWSGTTIIDVTAVDAGLPMEMNHSATTLSCASCHPNAELGSFYPGQFHGALVALDAGQPVTCAVCHARGAPSGFVGPVVTDGGRTPPTGEMRHDVDAGASADCSACHAPPALLSDAGWTATSLFHARVQPGTCLECHANTRPGVLDSTNSALPAGRRINHRGPDWLEECSTCHLASNLQSWAGGRFHLPGALPRQSCLPCHEGERPTAPALPPFGPPFDYGTNMRGVKHGAGQDCVLCHASTTQRFDAGFFGHDAGVVVTQTCVACHTTQRPPIVVNGFDHSIAGTGDCFGCHQASLQLGRWDAGERYPAGNLISSSDPLLTVTQTSLLRTNGLVTGTAVTQVPLYNAMRHTSVFALDAGPAPGDGNACWHCHAGTPVGSLNITAAGVFHLSLTNFRVTPASPVTPLPQPGSGCTDCHSNMRPRGIVQNTVLRPMDHALSAADCSLCHAMPGGTWRDGTLHANVDAGALDCTSCHYTLMADSPQADVLNTADGGYQMRHRSSQMRVQQCDVCHTTALGSAPGAAVASQWRPGVYHASVTTQPMACADCHRPVSVPVGPTVSQNAGRTMNHAASVVAARDCAFCHAADATSPVWSRSTRLHVTGLLPQSCNVCHASDAPAGLHDTDVTTSASAATGVSGHKVQLMHSDANVSGRDCAFCHLVPGGQFNGATFHPRFTGGAAPTGRCSSCHLNLKPTAALPGQDHSAFGATGTDCSACHGWPGPNGSAAPSWKQTASGPAAPGTLSVGGFTIAQPPAPNATTPQAGLNGLPHPAIPAGGSCTSCHTMASGGRGALGYDHVLAPATGCAACHEAGSDLVATPWTLNAPGAVMVAAQCSFGSGQVADRGGDTRPIGLASLPCSPNGAARTCGTDTCVRNHFYPADCGECHRKPPGVPATTQTGAAFASAWRFVHSYGAPVQQSTCAKCH